METLRRFPYAPRWRMVVWCGLFFGAGALFLTHLAATNTRGLIIEHAITLGPEGATVFHWCLAGVCWAFVLAAALLAARLASGKSILELGDDALVLPHGFMQRKRSVIPYSSIEGLTEMRASGQTFLYIYTATRRFTITAALLPDAASYSAVKTFLSNSVPARTSR